jgi:hypothetical protein
VLQAKDDDARVTVRAKAERPSVPRSVSWRAQLQAEVVEEVVAVEAVIHSKQRKK